MRAKKRGSPHKSRVSVWSYHAMILRIYLIPSFFLPSCALRLQVPGGNSSWQEDTCTAPSPFPSCTPCLQVLGIYSATLLLPPLHPPAGGRKTPAPANPLFPLPMRSNCRCTALVAQPSFFLPALMRSLPAGAWCQQLLAEGLHPAVQQRRHQRGGANPCRPAHAHCEGRGQEGAGLYLLGCQVAGCKGGEGGRGGGEAGEQSRRDVEMWRCAMSAG